MNRPSRLVLSLAALLGATFVYAQDSEVAPPAANVTTTVAPEVATAPVVQQLSLMMMIEQGGVILWVIMGLGFVALVFSLYLLLTVTPRREAPRKLAKRVCGAVGDNDLIGAYRLCEGREELLARVIRAGLKMSGHERFVIQEAMESEGERGAAVLWQRIAYLNNIATLAPLLGLLGTVWGMMQAFSAIAFDTAQVKGLTMAYSVAEAMITTAGGLVLAIPVMAIYFYLRGRVVKIVAEVEGEATEVVEALVKAQKE